MATAEKSVGNLAPFRDLSQELQQRADADREFRGDGDPVVRVLTTIRKRLEEALQTAQDPELTLTIEEYAEREGITKSAAYKRYQAGGIPGAEKRPGVGVVIPADYATRSTGA